METKYYKVLQNYHPFTFVESEEVETRLTELIENDPVFREEMKALARADELNLDWFTASLAAELAGKAVIGWSETQWLTTLETNSDLQWILRKEQIRSGGAQK